MRRLRDNSHPISLCIPNLQTSEKAIDKSFTYNRQDSDNAPFHLIKPVQRSQHLEGGKWCLSTC